MTSVNDQVSGILSSLPLDKLISTPLMSACTAQVQLSKATVDFIQQVGFDKDGNLKMISMNLTEEDVSGGRHDVSMNIPLLTIINTPCLYIQNVNIDLIVEVDAMSAKKTTSESENTSSFGLQVEGGYSGWGFNCSVAAQYETTAKLSSTVANNDKLNTKAKYSIHLEAENRQPIGLVKLLDRLTSNDKLVQKTAATDA
jgi:hypothetical protein